VDVTPREAATSEGRVPREQLVYARWLDWGTRIGLGLLLASFLAYIAGIATPHVPLDRLPQLWALPVEQYRAAAHAPAGWQWIAIAMRGDYLNYIGIVFLALVTFGCYLRLLPAFAARNDKTYTLLALMEILVLAAVAAGLVGGAH
jgi:hypothetical protein